MCLVEESPHNVSSEFLFPTCSCAFRICRSLRQCGAVLSLLLSLSLSLASPCPPCLLAPCHSSWYLRACPSFDRLFLCISRASNCQTVHLFVGVSRIYLFFHVTGVCLPRPCVGASLSQILRAEPEKLRHYLSLAQNATRTISVCVDSVLDHR